MSKTTTFLTFVGEQCGKAEEAIIFYTSLFKDSGIKSIERYKNDKYGEKDGLIKLAVFVIAGQKYMVSESILEHKFSFTPAISIFVQSDTIKEQKILFDKLSEEGKVMLPLENSDFGNKSGWVNDKYGVSWQLNLIK